MMAPQWLSRVIIVQLGCLGIRIRNNCQLPLLNSAGLLHAFIISCLWIHLIIIFILYLTLDMCLHLVIKYNWPITSPSEQLSSLPWYIDIYHDQLTTSQCPSLLSWRLTCQLKPAVVSGGDHRGTINRRQGPSSRGRISLTCNWPWVPANQTQHSSFFLKRIELWTW